MRTLVGIKQSTDPDPILNLRLNHIFGKRFAPVVKLITGIALKLSFFKFPMSVFDIQCSSFF